MHKKIAKRLLEKITVNRKIVELLIEGISLTQIQKRLNKGKGYIINIRDQALEYCYIIPIAEGAKIYKQGSRKLPAHPESPFAIIDSKNEKLLETDKYLEPEKVWISERLDAGWSPQTIFEEIKTAISRPTFYRYLHRQDLMKKVDFKSSCEIIHAPGECLQVDWAKLCDVVDPVTGKKKTISMFIGVLGFSRYQMIRVVERLNFSTTIDVLQSMLKELGGVPRKITSDNPKVFVIEASKYEAKLNVGYERFAGHYGFTIEALPPSDPQKKGKVERLVQLARRLFESYDVTKYSLESAQVHIDKKNELSNLRKHGSHLQKPLEVFLNREAQELRPLPAVAYDKEEINFCKIRVDSYVCFDNKYYRVHDKFKNESALVIGNSKQVIIYSKGLLLDIYERITDPFQKKSCKEIYKSENEKTMSDHGYLIKRACGIGEDVGRFAELVIARGEGFVDFRVIWGLLSLDKKYDKESINKVCRQAIELSQINLRTVFSLLKLTCNEKKQSNNFTEEEYKLANGKFTRPMSEYKKHLHLVVNNKLK